MYDHAPWAVEVKFEPELADVFWHDVSLAKHFGALFHVDAVKHDEDVKVIDQSCTVADEFIQRMIDNAK